MRLANQDRDLSLIEGDNLKNNGKCHISYTDYFDKMFFLQKMYLYDII